MDGFMLQILMNHKPNKFEKNLSDCLCRKVRKKMMIKLFKLLPP